MQDIISAIWMQDFESLLALSSLHLLLLLLATVLLLESSFVFLPLPGDGLVLFVGGLVAIDAISFPQALLWLTLASFVGSLLAYIQGRTLQGSSLMPKLQVILPDKALLRSQHLLSKYGFLSLFISRFIPFVRVLTPMLMGVSKLSFTRTVIISFTSSFTWVLVLLLAGQWLMGHPLVMAYQEVATKGLLIFSVTLMVSAFITLFVRLAKQRRQATIHSNSN